MSTKKIIPLPGFTELSADEMINRSNVFYNHLKSRRTVRDFSEKKVSREVIEKCILAAGTAPSGANLQPWQFVVVSDPLLKKKIRIAAEEEEKEFYTNRAPKEWLEALVPLGTDQNKPFLETAPHLIVVFSKNYDLNKDGAKRKNYYAAESTGIACGILITALHNAGLVSLTHTPAPMKFLNVILGRPENEKPFLILVTGYPSPDAKVPDIHKKELNEFCIFL